jgi:trans-aconitate methyltransferase
MRADIFRLMASHEDRHWWFAGRRAVIAALVARADLGARPRILEVGCGTGGNVGVLASRGDFEVLEPDDIARHIVQEKYPDLTVHRGALPWSHSLEPSSFDLVLALDVLEHVQEDAASLRALVDLVRPGGWIVVTVPAHPILYGSHDIRLDHQRRYTKRRLAGMCRESGADLMFFTAFNTLLAPIAVTYRLLEKLSPVTFPHQEHLPVAPVNSLFARVFSAEALLVARRALPFGLSFGVLLRRPNP